MENIVLSANTSWYLYNFRASTIKALQQHGYTIFCLSPLDDYSKRLVDELGCSWQEIKMDNQGSHPIKDMLLFWSLFKLYKKIQPVAVYHFTIKNNIYGTWAAKLSKVRSINNISGLGTAFINNNLTSKLVRILYKLSQPFAYKVFCQNPEDYELLVNEGLVARSKLTLLPGSGVNIERFHPSLNHNRDTTEPFVFLYVGRMLADKGVLELIEAAKSLYDTRQDFTVQLCGYADAKNSSAISPSTLDEWAKLPFINYLGPSDCVETIYGKADCVVLPSYREGMPRCLLEAGAMGLPSITTDVPGCRNIITHNYNGLICNVKSADSLFNSMQALLNLPSNEFEKLGVNARKKVVSEFNETIVIDKTVSILKSIS